MSCNKVVKVGILREVLENLLQPLSKEKFLGSVMNVGMHTRDNSCVKYSARFDEKPS